MIPAYEGKEPYIFVSYAHKDSASIFRIIELLNKRGYRVWYDEGIEPGSEWPEYIANHLLGAEMVIAFLTPRSVNSVNCRREINFALSKEKPVLTIFMQELKVPAGMELQLSTQQSVLYYQYDSEERFLDKVETCKYLAPCKRNEYELPLTEHTPESSASMSRTSKHSGNMTPAKAVMIAGAFLVVLLGVFWFAGSGKKGGQQAAGIASTDAPAQGAADGKSADHSSAGASKEVSSVPNEGTDTSEPGDSAHADEGETWNYTIIRTGENTIYSFDRGPQIVLPASWEGKITLIDEGERVGFYHTASMNSWDVDGYKNTGYLFKLSMSKTQDYINYPSFSDLGKTEEGYFYLMFPTDFQGYAENERIRDQYQEMYSEISYVKMNSYLEK